MINGHVRRDLAYARNSFETSGITIIKTMSAAARLPAIHVVNATKQHTATLFLFHGSGSRGEDMKDWIHILNREELKFPHIKIVYPSAPAQRYSYASGTLSNVWFNRYDISIKAPEDANSVNSMCDTVTELIEKEVANGISHDRIVLGGFSMGGALSMYLAYRYKTPLAGCFVMSSFLNANSIVYEHLRKHDTAGKTPLLQYHGTDDLLVPLEWGKETNDILRELGVNAKFVSLNKTDHEITRVEVESLKTWLQNIVPEDNFKAKI